MLLLRPRPRKANPKKQLRLSVQRQRKVTCYPRHRALDVRQAKLGAVPPHPIRQARLLLQPLDQVPYLQTGSMRVRRFQSRHLRINNHSHAVAPVLVQFWPPRFLDLSRLVRRQPLLQLVSLVGKSKAQAAVPMRPLHGPVARSPRRLRRIVLTI